MEQRDAVTVRMERSPRLDYERGGTGDMLGMVNAQRTGTDSGTPTDPGLERVGGGRAGTSSLRR